MRRVGEKFDPILDVEASYRRCGASLAAVLEGCIGGEAMTPERAAEIMGVDAERAHRRLWRWITLGWLRSCGLRQFLPGHKALAGHVSSRSDGVVGDAVIAVLSKSSGFLSLEDVTRAAAAELKFEVQACLNQLSVAGWAESNDDGRYRCRVQPMRIENTDDHLRRVVAAMRSGKLTKDSRRLDDGD